MWKVTAQMTMSTLKMDHLGIMCLGNISRRVVDDELPKCSNECDVRRVTSSSVPGRFWLVTRELPDQLKSP